LIENVTDFQGVYSITYVMFCCVFTRKPNKLGKVI